MSYKYKDREAEGILNRIKRFFSGNDVTRMKKGIKIMPPKAEDFQIALDKTFKGAEHGKKKYVDVLSRDLHRKVGGYPGQDHRMPTCCSVMKSNIQQNDVILEQPPKGKGASLLIRYRIPR